MTLDKSDHVIFFKYWKIILIIFSKYAIIYFVENELENELENEENAVQLLISQMNIDIMANNYINIDDRIEIAEVIDEEEIIAAVQEDQREKI